MSAPRVAPLPLDSPEVLNAAPVAVAGSPGGINGLATMLRNRPLYDVWRPLGRYLNGQSSIGSRERELVILRTAWLCDGTYCWANHAVAARTAGLGDSEIEAVKVGSNDPTWNTADAALVRAAEELRMDGDITDRTWAQLATSYDDAQLIEIVMLAGYFFMVASTFNALRVQPDR